MSLLSTGKSSLSSIVPVIIKNVILYIREFSAVSSDVWILITIELPELSLSVHLSGTSSQTTLKLGFFPMLS